MGTVPRQTSDRAQTPKATYLPVIRVWPWLPLQRVKVMVVQFDHWPLFHT